jgi:hypothetical protein
MIDTFPTDFSTTTYDLITADGSRWSFGHDDSGYYLLCGNLRQPVIESNNKPTFFAPGYVNINLHGFTIGGVDYVITGVTPNANWTEPPEVTSAPPADSDALAAKERTFAAMLLHYATAFSVDLTTLPDINISAMLQAAQAAGATPAEIADATAMLLAAKADIEAEAGGSWAECWQGLKGRLPGYIAELSQNA